MRRYRLAVPGGAAVGAGLGALAVWISSLIPPVGASLVQYLGAVFAGAVFGAIVGRVVVRKR